MIATRMGGVKNAMGVSSKEQKYNQSTTVLQPKEKHLQYLITSACFYWRAQRDSNP